MIEPLGKVNFTGMTTAVPPVAPVVEKMPGMEASMLPSTLERMPEADAFTSTGMPVLNPGNARDTYTGAMTRQREVGTRAAVAFQGLTTTSAVIQSAERGNKAAGKQLDITI